MAQIKPHCVREVGHDPHDAGSTSPLFSQFVHYQSFHKSRESLCHSRSARLSRSHYISLMRLTATKLSRASDRDLVNWDPPDRRAPICMSLRAP